MSWYCTKIGDKMVDILSFDSVKPFDEWLFEKEGVWPKHEYNSFVLKKGVL